MNLRALFVCIVISFTGFSQSGNYFLSNFSPDEERFNITCFDIVQDDRGVFYFATQAGVLQFDGRNWDIIPTAGTLYSIARSADGQIYVAGSAGFGKIGKDELGMEAYQPLYNVKSNESIFQIVIRINHVYFLSDKNIFDYNTQSGEIKTIKNTDQTGSFLALHEIFEKPYVSTESRGIFEIESQKIAPTNFELEDSASVIFSMPYENRYLIGTDDNRLYLGTPNKELQRIILQDSIYANASVIVNATWVNENLIAIGTLRGGVIFINPNTGTTEEIINYNTGLPDNEVFALVCDKNKNVWAAHSYGFTRIAPYLPFRSFRYYPGLQGNLLCATTYNGIVYVGTSVGLFKLEKEDSYDEIVYYVEVPIKSQAVKKGEKEATPILTVEEKESKKGLFGFLKRKRKEAEPTQTATQPIDASGPAGVQKREFKREKRTRKILRKSHFVYKPVSGVDSKIAQLIHWKGKLIAAGLDGAFEINNDKLTRIVQEPIRFLFASEKLNKLIVSTYDDRLHQYQFTSDWKEDGLMEEINEPINYIFEEDNSVLWLCGFDKIFRVDLSKQNQPIKTLTIPKHNFDQLLGISLSKQVYIATTSGFYFYDPVKESLIEGDTLHKPTAYFASSSNLWFRDKHSWYTAGQVGGHNNLQLLNLFSSIRFIDSDAKLGNLWIITGNNELLQFNSETVRKDEVLYPLILKSIENNNILLPKRSSVKIEQDKSAIKIEVIRPDFIGGRFIEYRYLLEGPNAQWSEWSTNNNVIDIPFVPTGEYKLLIQSKDIFGRINELSPLTIEVKPPYWKQTWFYAAEFSVFLFLVILSFRLSYRFIFISRVLSLLSIIIFIEFIQTIAGATFSTHSSPVFDFVIQVGVAFIVLPVEGFLRRYFLQAITKRNQAKLRQIKGTDEEVLDTSSIERKGTDVQGKEDNH